MKIRIARIAAVIAAAVPLTLGGAAFAQASHGADDPAGHHHGHDHHHGHHHHHGPNHA